MEIERKFTLKELPENLESYPCHLIEQAYLNISPVIRVRMEDDEYYLTYKGSGMLAREEHNLPLTKEAYYHLRDKADGKIISKKRYLIPLLHPAFREGFPTPPADYQLLIELDVLTRPLPRLSWQKWNLAARKRQKPLFPLPGSTRMLPTSRNIIIPTWHYRGNKQKP